MKTQNSNATPEKSPSSRSHSSRYRMLTILVGIALLLTVLVTAAACQAAANREDPTDHEHESTQNLFGEQSSDQLPTSAETDGNVDVDPTPQTPLPTLTYTSNGNGTCYVSGIGTYNVSFLQIPVTAPNGDKVIGIGTRAFAGCTSLQYVFLPAQITSIGEYAFDGCNALQEFAVEEGNACFITDGGVLYNRDKTAIVCYPPAKTDTSFTIREDVTQIYAGAFHSIPNLKSVNYTGTVSQWAAILIGHDNTALTALPLTCNKKTK